MWPFIRKIEHKPLGQQYRTAGYWYLHGTGVGHYGHYSTHSHATYVHLLRFDMIWFSESIHWFVSRCDLMPCTRVRCYALIYSISSSSMMIIHVTQGESRTRRGCYFKIQLVLMVRGAHVCNWAVASWTFKSVHWCESVNVAILQGHGAHISNPL